LNALDPQLEVLTQSVASDDRGRHTTSAGRLHKLANGTRIIDTPGIRALGLWEVSPVELAFYFSEIAEHAQGCRFRDCTHTHEPRCAVLAAVDAGGISRARFDSYLRIRASLESARNITPGRMTAKYQG
jgi:ribosome biogenesis GTPase